MTHSARLLIAILLLALAGCSTFGDPYYRIDMPHYRPAAIFIAVEDNLYEVCGRERLIGNGCVRRWPEFARVYLRKGLTQKDYECVMKHEIVMHIIEGKNHDDRPINAADCGEN